MTALDRLVEQPLGARLAELATPLASRSESEPAWLAARSDKRVTASEARAVCSRAAWRRILSDKLYGSTFTGNAGTRRGAANESYWLTYAALEAGTAIVPNDRVWASITHPGIGATPDGFESDGDVVRGVEVKDHHEDWEPPSAGVLTPEHLDQILVGMFVFGWDSWRLIVGFSDDDGNPSTKRDPYIEIVVRDARAEARILELVDAITRFLAWWEEGAPEPKVSETLAPLRAELVRTKSESDVAKKAFDAARAKFETQLEKEHPGSLKVGWSHRDEEADDIVTIGRPSITKVLDEDAWRTADPKRYAAWRRGVLAVTEAAEQAKKKHQTNKVASHSLRVTVPKSKKAKA